EVGANLGQEAVVTAIHQRQQLAVLMNQFMAKYDLLLTPTMPVTAFPIFQNGAWGGDGVDIGWTPFTLTFNLTRQPAATIPCGLGRAGDRHIGEPFRDRAALLSRCARPLAARSVVGGRGRHPRRIGTWPVHAPGNRPQLAPGASQVGV